MWGGIREVERGGSGGRDGVEVGGQWSGGSGGRSEVEVE